MNDEFVKALRTEEALQILPLLPPTGKILEIGAGAGWQARIFSAHGRDVQAVELAQNQFAGCRAFPVTLFDGTRLPFADGTFAVVYSSSVLEHVASLTDLNREIHRVLGPDGLAIHSLPRGRWCVWTLATHLVSHFRHPRRLLSNPWPARHGVEGHWYSEPYLFRRRRWEKRFTALGWTTIGWRTNRLVYSGNSLLHFHLGLKSRRWLALLFGGVCQVFVLRPFSATPRR
jgi:SAM-dependent methyltransferase